MDEKIAKLQAATDEAGKLVQEHQRILDDATQRVEAAKDLLRHYLDPAEQAKLKVNDTKLPELLDMHARAKDRYEASLKRLETNQRYLAAMKEKLVGAKS